jgi:hypothetical protein
MTETDLSGMQESTGQEGAAQSTPLILPTSTGHQILTLIGAGFLCFEFVFLVAYFDQSWFALDGRFFGIPAVLLSVLVAHFLLLFAESRRACRWFSLIFKGKPAVAYRKWLQLGETGFLFGLKQVRYLAVDELELTLLGNLVVKSKAVCGEGAAFPDRVLKVPFAIAETGQQQMLLATIRSHKADFVENKRLLKSQESAASGSEEAGKGKFNLKALVQKGPQITQLTTAAIMALLLLDVGYSSFYYLELLKNYYLAETDLLAASSSEADRHFARAEDLRLHPLPFSWVSARFLKSSNVAAGIWEQRSRVLWLEGKRAEAIEDGRKAIDEQPTSLRHRLYQTRLLVEENKIPESREQINKILEEHKHALMPRLYILAIVKEHENAKLVQQEYKAQMDACYEDTYENEPRWPPGGNCFFTELFYSDDSRFLLDRFLGSKYESQVRTATATEKAAGQ